MSRNPHWLSPMPFHFDPGIHSLVAGVLNETTLMHLSVRLIEKNEP